MKDYYYILGVLPNANQDEIHEAFVSQVVKVGQYTSSTLDLDKGKAALKNVEEAYEVLSNPYQRLEYDKVYNKLRTGKSSVIDFIVKNIGKVCLMGFGLLLFITIISDIINNRSGMAVSIIGSIIVGFCLILGFLHLKDKFEKER